MFVRRKTRTVGEPSQSVPNFWSLPKRSLGGTYVSVRPFHLYRSLDEQDYRYNRRDLSDAERVDGVLDGIGGRRVTWKELTGRKQPEPGKPAPRPISRYPIGPF